MHCIGSNKNHFKAKNRQTCIGMATHHPHKQLKRIRSVLGITQKDAAQMLGVSYPYFLSIETGQRQLSAPLAGRIAGTFGVVRIFNRDEEPLMRGPKGRLVPFTKELYQQRRSRPHTYYLEDVGQVVRPTAAQYGQCVQALLEACQERGTTGRTLADFFVWFEQGISGDNDYEAFKRAFDRIAKGRRTDAFWALTDYRADQLDRLVGEQQERMAKRAEWARQKRHKK
jgi:transcriptional regulator with XRE-family HTH domain